MKFVLLALILASCGVQDPLYNKPIQKFRVGECLKNPVFDKQIIGRIAFIYGDFNYSLYTVKTSTYSQTLNEQEILLNDYKIVPCQEK